MGCAGMDVDSIESSQETFSLGTVKPSHKLCSGTSGGDFFGFRQASEEQIFVPDEKGEAQVLPQGQCVTISTLDPSSGISLDELDADLMGTGFRNLAENATKLERLLGNINTTLVGIVDGFVGTIDAVAEGAMDAVKVVNDLNTSLANGTKAGVNT